MPTDFSIKRWLEQLPDEEIEREMNELEEQIQALHNRHSALREARDLKQRFKDFYSHSVAQPIGTEAKGEDAAVPGTFIPSTTKVYAPELRPSSISKAVLLLMESGDKPEWTVGEISDGLIERGWLNRSTQAQRSLGAALSRMTTDGEIRRVSRGRYATASPDTASPSLLDSEEDASG